MSNIFNDSKTFVDMPMRVDPEVISTAFNEYNGTTNQNLLDFVNQYFAPAGSDIYSATPVDWQASPPILDKIPAEHVYHDWAQDLNDLWKVLGRRLNESVAKHAERHSFYPIPYPTIVPGGRFRESYYWDSYFIIQGLLVCDMHISALNIIRNLLNAVSMFGFVPNGGRVYYLDRSQPPLLSSMVMSLVEYIESIPGLSADIDNEGTTLTAFLQMAYPLLKQEHTWWMSVDTGHVVQIPFNGSYVLLNRYHSADNSPRPESYEEDYTAASAMSSSKSKDLFYTNIRAGAESGWDFSSRWFPESVNISAVQLPSTNTLLNITNIGTSEIVPPDLNAIMYTMEMDLAVLSEMPSVNINNRSETLMWVNKATARRVAIRNVLFDESHHRWSDYNITSGNLQDTAATVASYIPLWAVNIMGDCISEPDNVALGYNSTAIIESLQRSQLLQNGGVLTTTEFTGQQWDYPNAWPPLVLFLQQGLIRVSESICTSSTSQDMASLLASTISNEWLQTNYVGYANSSFMFEKYDAMLIGGGGGGGEYTPQVGFGWTNGVALLLISNFFPSNPLPPSNPESDDDSTSNSYSYEVFYATMILFALAVLTCICCRLWRDRQQNLKNTQIKDRLIDFDYVA